MWVVEDENKDSVIAKHRFVNETVEIPRNVLAADFHRFAHRPKLDLTNLSEYAVLKNDFSNSSRFWSLGEKEGTPDSWPDLAEKRLSHLGFMRRIDITAEGLRHLTYFSETPRLYHGMMFCLPGMKTKDARRLSLWFDSSLNLLQMLVSRIPSRGGWTEYHRNTVANFYIPEPGGFDDGQEQTLDTAFEKVNDVDFPSIAEQLIRNTPEDTLTEMEFNDMRTAFHKLHDKIGEGFSARRTMDRAILDVIGVDKERHEKILSVIYPALLKEIIALKTMMD